MLLRRDVTVEDWSDPMANKYGLKATTRFGLGILRSNAIAKMTNKNPLSKQEKAELVCVYSPITHFSRTGAQKNNS